MTSWAVSGSDDLRVHNIDRALFLQFSSLESWIYNNEQQQCIGYKANWSLEVTEYTVCVTVTQQLKKGEKGVKLDVNLWKYQIICTLLAHYISTSMALNLLTLSFIINSSRNLVKINLPAVSGRRCHSKIWATSIYFFYFQCDLFGDERLKVRLVNWSSLNINWNRVIQTDSLTFVRRKKKTIFYQSNNYCFHKMTENRGYMLMMWYRENNQVSSLDKWL